MWKSYGTQGVSQAIWQSSSWNNLSNPSLPQGGSGMHIGLCPVQTPAKGHLLWTGKNSPHWGETEPLNYRGRIAKPQNNFCPSRWYLEGKALASRSKYLRSNQGQCFCTWHLSIILVFPTLFFFFVLYLTALREFVSCDKAHSKGHCNSPSTVQKAAKITTYSTQIRQNTR